MTKHNIKQLNRQIARLGSSSPTLRATAQSDYPAIINTSKSSKTYGHILSYEKAEQRWNKWAQRQKYAVQFSQELYDSLVDDLYRRYHDYRIRSSGGVNYSSRKVNLWSARGQTDYYLARTKAVLQDAGIKNITYAKIKELDPTTIRMLFDIANQAKSDLNRDSGSSFYDTLRNAYENRDKLQEIVDYNDEDGTFMVDNLTLTQLYTGVFE